MADAVLKLPSLTKPEDASTQIGTQDLFRDGHDQSVIGKTMLGIPLADLSGDQRLGHEHEIPDKTCQEKEKVGPIGFEPMAC